MERIKGPQHKIEGEIETSQVDKFWPWTWVSGTISFVSMAEDQTLYRVVKNLRVRRSLTGRRFVQARFEEKDSNGKKRRYWIQCPIELED